MNGRKLSRALLVAASGWALAAQAHVRQRYFLQSSGNPPSGTESIIHWPADTAVKVSVHQFSGTLGDVKGGLDTRTTIAFATVQTAIGDSLAQWFGLGSVTLFPGGLVPSLALSLTAENKPFPFASACESTTDGNPDGVHNILFTSKLDASCSSSIRSLPGVIGVTRVLSRPTTGEIVEADMQLNDVDYLMKTSGSNNLSASPQEVVLKDVLTHEIGHFFGFDHSSQRRSTMLFQIAEDLQTTKSDDRMGILSLYPPTSGGAALGSLEGSLTDAAGAPVFGGVVFALNARTLEVAASDMTNLNGAFTFCALPPGVHVAFANAYRPFGDNLGGYYVGGLKDDGTRVTSNQQGCFNVGCALMTTALQPSWYGKDATGATGGQALRLINVAAGATSRYVNITAQTSVPAPTPPATPADIPLEEVRALRLSADPLPLGGQLTNVGTHLLRFTAPTSGAVQIRTASLRLYTRLKLKVELQTDAGTDVTTARCPVTAGDRTTGEAFDEPSVVNPSADIANARDPWLNCTGLTAGAAYRVQVTGTALSCGLVPGNSASCVAANKESASTDVPLYLFTVYETSRLGDLTAGDALEASTRAAATYDGLPTCGNWSLGVKGPSVTATTTDEGKKRGCCGTLGPADGSGPSGPGSFLLTLLFMPLTWWMLWRFRGSPRRYFRL